VLNSNSFYFYITVSSFIFGIFVSTFYTFGLPVLSWLTILSVVFALFWYRDKNNNSEIKTSTFWFLLSIITVAFALGALRMEVTKWSQGNSVLEEQVEQTVTLTGVVVREPDQRENKVHLYIKTDNDLVLASVDRYYKVAYGDMVEVEGRLNKPSSFVTEFGRTFNYEGYLLAKGVEYQISFAKVEVLDSGLGNPIISYLLKFKHAFMGRLEKVVSEPAVGLGEGLLLGVKQALGAELETAFRKTGIIHIVVLSGYNVMLVVAFVMFVISRVFSVTGRVFFGILAIVAFALLVGLSATVVRASIMASLLLLMQATGRNYLVMRGLFVAGLIMLVFNPYLLVYDVGFQLSFLATLGLILVAPILEKLFSITSDTFGLKMLVVATVSTQIAVSPLLLYQIGELSVSSVIVNVLVLPVVPLAMFLTFITGMMAFVSLKLAILFSYPTYWSLTYINNVALWFADLPMSAFAIPAFSFYFVPISYIFLGLLVWFFYRKYQFAFGQGDLGERLLVVSNETEKNTNSDISDWKIEEDLEIQEVGELSLVKEKVDEKKRAAPTVPSSPKDTPIFFR